MCKNQEMTGNLHPPVEQFSGAAYCKKWVALKKGYAYINHDS